jgi:xylulokinase
VDDPSLDTSNAAWFGLLDVHTLDWSNELLQQVGIAKEMLPAVVPSRTIVGKVSRAASQETGLVEGTPIVTGGGDQQVGSIGCGVVEPGVVSVSLGTASGVMAFSDRPVLDDNIGYYTQPHALPRSWEMEMFTITTGAALRWYRDTIGTVEQRTARETGKDVYEIICEGASRAAVGSDGLLFFPTMAGTFKDPTARGIWLGLTLSNDRNALARSILEGIAFEIKSILTSITRGGFEIREVRLTGGGARSDFWFQLQADVYGAPVVKPTVTDASLLGCLFIAGLGIGVFSSLTEFAKSVVHVEKRYLPNEKLVPAYAERHRVYMKAQELLSGEGIFRDMSLIEGA